jgi:hypothetical protein
MEGLERRLVLAKQVLSQLSYTPTVGTFLILKHLQLFETSENPRFASYRVRTVSKLLTFRWHGDDFVERFPFHLQLHLRILLGNHLNETFNRAQATGTGSGLVSPESK